MEEIDRRHHRVRQTAEEGTGVSTLPRERKRSHDRNGLHRPRPRSDDLHSPVGKRMGCGEEGGKEKEGWAKIERPRGNCGAKARQAANEKYTWSAAALGCVSHPWKTAAKPKHPPEGCKHRQEFRW